MYTRLEEITMDTENYKGYTIKVEQDEWVANPREEFDHLPKMVCFHHRYFTL